MISKLTHPRYQQRTPQRNIVPPQYRCKFSPFWQENDWFSKHCFQIASFYIHIMQTSKYVPLTYLNDARLSLAFQRYVKSFCALRKVIFGYIRGKFCLENSYIERKKVEIHSLPIEQWSHDRVKNMIFLCWPIDRNLQRFHWEERNITP